MSDTPRTDAALFAFNEPTPINVQNLCRNMEKEIKELNGLYMAALDKWNACRVELDTIKQQLEYVTELANLQTKCLNDVTTQRNDAQKQLDSYFADRDKSPWKSVDEPPEKSGWYLYHDKIGYYEVCYYDNVDWRDRHGYVADVTHWTEIPDLCL
jgi:hypothetical protein